MNHSPIGPSSLKRILACPGSVALAAQCPPLPPSEYAEEGTLAHTVAERYLEAGEIWYGPSVTDEMIEGAKLYASVIDLALSEADNITVPLQVEKKVCASSIDKDLWGTCDAYFIADDCLDVFDYKFGKGVLVSPEMNPQMLAYAKAILDTHGIVVSRIRLTIVQPRNGGVSTWTAPSTVLTEFRHKVQDALKSNELNINEECKWCPALAICPKRLEEIKDKFDVVPTAPVKELPPVEIADAEKFKIYLENADLLESWIKAIRGQAFAAVGRGLVIDGYEIVETLGNRKWRKGAEDEIKQNYADIKLYEQPKFKTPAQLEKLIPKDIVEKYTVRESSGSKLQRTTKSAPDLFEHFNVMED